MKDNRVEDGMMFKLEFDPRVIGNKILPNGEKRLILVILLEKQAWMNFHNSLMY